MTIDMMIEKVCAGQLTKIPSPRNRLVEARIIGYAEGYVILRHNRCVPFIEHRKDVLRHLESCRNSAPPPPQSDHIHAVDKGKED